MAVIKVFALVLFLFLTPVLMGMPWTRQLPAKDSYRLLACFPIGFFVQLAIFQLIVVPMALLTLPFTLMCWCFSIVVLLYSAWSAYREFRHLPFSIRLWGLNAWELFYLIALLGLLMFQLYNGLVRDTTVYSYDDASYVTYAADTLRFNSIQTIDANTGLAQTLNVVRAMQGWLYFPAFLSAVSGIPVAVMERTILEVYDILLAYVVYAYMASVLFRKLTDRYIFLIILSLVFIFGYYSSYSVTFRLLGPNYQGKAVAAASFFPLVFALLIQLLRQKYAARNGRLLMLLSIASASLSLFSGIIMILNVTLVVIMSVIAMRRNWKQLLYIPWSLAFPALYCGVFLLDNYGP